VISAEGLGPDREDTVVQSLGLLVPADEVIPGPQDVKGGRDVRVIRAERLLAELDELPIPALAIVEEPREVYRRVCEPARRRPPAPSTERVDDASQERRGPRRWS